jgi:predicted regulator of Ras-like GTPase activity (Roadblock/LC7/MglB family)
VAPVVSAEALTPKASVAHPDASVPAATVEEVIEIPFRPLFAKLSAAVQSAPHSLPENGGASLRLPLGLVRDQIRMGAIKLSFSQFREFSPAGVFPDSFDGAALEVDVPLGEVIPRISPAQLPRRANQRKVEVPEEIAPLFGADGKPVQGLKVSEEKPKPARPAAKTSPAPAAHAPVPAPVPTAPSTVPAAEAKQSTGISASPRKSASIAQPATPAPASVIAEPALDTEPIRAPKLDPALASLKPKTPAPALESKPAQQAFQAALMDFASHWTAAGKEELANLYRHSVEIPRERIESGLRKGKVSFPWREFKLWIKIAPGNSLATLPEELEVELPLNLVAPRFLEERTPLKNQKRLLPSEDIPEVFNVKPAPAPAPAPTEPVSSPEPDGAPMQAAPAPQPVIVAPAAEASVAPETAPANILLDYGLIFGQPEKKSWTINEVIQATGDLRGVEGALIADSDGLLMGGSWSGEIAPESVAAFIPQMFRRILEYSIELKLGDPADFILMIENVPLQIFKAGSNFLAVLGKSGENLPKPQLMAVAKRLTQTVK